jgi:hypothetical protein
MSFRRILGQNITITTTSGQYLFTKTGTKIFVTYMTASLGSFMTCMIYEELYNGFYEDEIKEKMRITNARIPYEAEEDVKKDANKAVMPSRDKMDLKYFWLLPLYNIMYVILHIPPVLRDIGKVTSQIVKNNR